MYETLGQNSLPAFKYLYIETDGRARVDQTPDPQGDRVKRVSITVDSVGGALARLRNLCGAGALEWCPQDLAQELSQISEGAGNFPPGGRLALWKNWEEVKSAILGCKNELGQANVVPQTNDALQDVGRRLGIPDGAAGPAGWVDANALDIYVVGTLVGGTNSGIFVDLGYLVREVCTLGDQAALDGIFFVPTEHGNQLHRANAWASLEACEFFRRGTYWSVWPDTPPAPKVLRRPPYRRVYLVSPAYGMGTFAEMDVDGTLCEMVALTLLANLLGMSAKRLDVLANAPAAQAGFYMTFGTAAITHPKYLVSEAAACEKGKELCDTLCDEKGYWDRAQSKQITINATALQGEAAHTFRSELPRALEGLRTAERQNLNRALETLARAIIAGREPDIASALDQRFGSRGDHLRVLIDNADGVKNQLLELTRLKIKDELVRTENLACCAHYLSGWRKSIQETTAFWKELISLRRSAADDRVGEAESGIERCAHAWLLYWPLQERYNAVLDELRSLLRKTEMYVMLPKLEELDKEIEPIEAELTSMRENLGMARTALETRLGSLRTVAAQADRPIHRVWARGDFDQDVTQLHRTMERASIARVSGPAAWEFLSHKGEDIAATMKKKFQQEALTRMHQARLDPDVAEAANRDEIAATVTDLVRRAKAGYLRFRPDAQPFEGHNAHVPRLVIGASTYLEEHRNRVNQWLNLEGEASFRHYEVPFLRHMLIYYDEKGRFNPDLLAATAAMKAAYEATPENMKETTWRALRRAYDLEAARRAGEMLELNRLMLDFFVEWVSGEDKAWRAVKKREQVNLPISTDDQGDVVYVIDQDIGAPLVLPLLEDDVNRFALSADAFTRVKGAVRGEVNRFGLQGMNDLFKNDVYPYLLRRHGRDRVYELSNYYFSEPGGLVRRLIQSSEAAAVARRLGKP
jgi:hypothetical protein